MPLILLAVGGGLGLAIALPIFASKVGSGPGGQLATVVGAAGGGYILYKVLVK
jgi:uncharacterized protein YcfJ